MALHESVLEEFGLAPLWVRRGMAVHESADAAAGAVSAAQAAQADDAGVERSAAQVSGDVRQTQAGLQPAQQSVQRTQPSSGHQTLPQTQPSAGRRPVSGRPSPEPEHHAAQPTPTLARTASPNPSPSRANPHANLDRNRNPRRRSSGFNLRPRSKPQRHVTRLPGRKPLSSSGPRRRLNPRRNPVRPSLICILRRPARRRFRVVRRSARPSLVAKHAAEKPALPAIHTLDWDALSERVAGCQLCRLCEKRTNTRVRRRRSRRRLDADRRSAGRKRGPSGRALRRPGGQAARQHAAFADARARHQRLHRECDQVPPARQPQSRSRTKLRVASRICNARCRWSSRS